MNKLIKHTYLLIATLPSSSASYWMYLSHPRKISDPDFTNSYDPESHQISKRYTEIIADYCAEIKIAILQSVLQCHGDEFRSSSNCGRSAAKTARFNSVNSENIGRKFTKFVYNVAQILPFYLLKADLRSANSLSNGEARSKGRSWRCMRPSSKFNWLP